MPIIEVMEDKLFGPLIRQEIEQGRLEGRLEGEAALLGSLLEDRFSSVPEWVSTRVAAASEPQIRRWARRLLTAASIEEVFAPDPA